ncbi:hypothetical protein EJ05DRAFT_253982 [Pseudovirgaria hyperparasitica]|uniref:Calcium permease family membrane transporter n=1 Tax=Pseudovirgaria hyperparasitica TaxID=470096 RepID=A0A6A6WE92_9PEZI|nr:uncharacterized protein EJ05DRAFT_253982 [Pseudovirgaria hyperparasitica]KAF2761138.1 hypothetical protein EJ05DRAFT_253982 [Pseudovirgaria hyperparasitica]
MSDPKRPKSSAGEEAAASARATDWSAVQESSTQSPATERRHHNRSQTSTSVYGTISGNTTRTGSTSVEPSPQQSRPKKPGMGRRPSSHRNQHFSVHDAQEEVDEDMAKIRQARQSSGTLRRQPSTVRRRVTAQPPKLSTVEGDDDEPMSPREVSLSGPKSPDDNVTSGEEATVVAGEDEEEEEVETPGADDDDADLSDAESFTLRDRQQAINETHPFGIRIWKPALYKKDRSVQKNAEGDIHSTPGLFVSRWLVLFNFIWSILFGWWLAAIAAAGGLFCLLFGFQGSCVEYGTVLLGLARYLIYPFGKYVRLIQDEAYAEEDEGEGRSISEYEQWQSGDIEEGRLFFGPINIQGSIIGRRRNSIDSTASETQSLLGRTGRGNSNSNDNDTRKRRLFGRGKWTLGRIIFFIAFYGLLAPSLLLVSGICWLLVFTIPMGKVTLLLFDHMRRHPLALSFHADGSDVRRGGEQSSSILLCTYRAVGTRYWKYTIDGTNIFLINLLGIVAFVIFDYWVLGVALGIRNALTSSGFVFVLALFSIIPLAYFIGQAVASISAQSSMGIGATVNALFSTIVEVFLYCVALKEGKAQLVEGSIIGSIFAAILFLPGLSMCFGALKRKTQRFNVRSAGVTSTMLLFAIIGCFSPTLFYQIYGSHELNCHQCAHHAYTGDRDCRRCYFSQAPAIHDRFYKEALKPYIWFCSVLLFLSYVVGLLFTLRTHAAVIWNNEIDEKKPEKHDMTSSQLSTSGHFEHPHTLNLQSSFEAHSGTSRSDIRQTQLYKRILGQSLKSAGLTTSGEVIHENHKKSSTAPSTIPSTPHVVPPKADGEMAQPESLHVEGLSDEQNNAITQCIAEIAATAAAVAARDATKAPRKVTQAAATVRAHSHRGSTVEETHAHGEAPAEQAAGGHDAPNWSRKKSTAILLSATVAYAIIAEILVNTVDAVLENVDIDEKFLGITLFALVPNTTEFLNAISFAMNGNIALSMEIGSAYALQVCLLQVPALVLFSAFYGASGLVDSKEVIHHTFTLIFPQWDMVTVVLCVFLLSYVYGEGRSNYFKGSILILAYLVVTVGFYLSSFNEAGLNGVDPYDTLALGGLLESTRFESSSFKVKGSGTHGRAF